MERQILAVVGKGEDTVQVVFLVLFLGGIGKEAGHVFVMRSALGAKPAGGRR